MKQSRAAVLRQRLDAIADELARIENMPDEPPEGSVIRFKMNFNSWTPTYAYAAIRAVGRWYTTGGSSSQRIYSWEELLEWMQTGTNGFEIMRPPARGVRVSLGGGGE